MKARTAAHRPARPSNYKARRTGAKHAKENPEVRFMREMIDHHDMAVTMSEKHLKEAEHAELKHLCESIITSQRAEIEQMQHWLQEWYGIEHSKKKRHVTADGGRSRH